MMTNTTSSVNSALDPKDPWGRHIEQTYGGRSMRDVSGYWDIPGQRRIMGGATPVSSSSSNSWFRGSGSVRINRFGSGGTPSDPGGHNWDTVDNMFTNTQKLVSGHKGRLDRARQLEMNKQSYNTNKQLSAWLQSQGFPSASGQQGMGNQQDMGEQSADNSQPKQPSWIFRTRVGQRAAQKAGDLAVRGIDKLESAWNKRRAGNIPQDTDQSEFDIDDPFRPFE